MSMPVLQPLQCLKCQSPLPAAPDEVAWLCPTCGQAARLDETQPAGLTPLEIFFSAGIQPGLLGRPFWVAAGTVSVYRETYSGNDSRQSQEFWQGSHNFCVPAYACSLDESINLGMQFLRQPVVMVPGPAASFRPVTLALEDLYPMAEFIVMGIEAERRDNLKLANIRLKLEAPILWILP